LRKISKSLGSSQN
jgi:hypothetical protein